MDYHYHQEGWGPLQQPFNTFPVYSSLRATGSSETEEFRYGGSFVDAERNQGLSQPFAYPTSSIHPLIDTDNSYQPRHLPIETLIPQTPVQSYIPALPPSISPRDIHIPRYTGLEVTIPESSYQPDQQLSPLFDITKYDGPAMEADTDNDSCSDSEYDFGSARQVNRSLLNDLTSSNSQIASCTQNSGYADQPDSSGGQQPCGESTPIPTEELPVEPSPIAPPTLVNPPLIGNSKRSQVLKRKTQSAVNNMKEEPVTRTLGKPTSGRQVLLAKKAKPGRRPRPTKTIGGKKSSANEGKSKVKTVTKFAAVPESDSLISFHQSSMTNDNFPKNSISNSSSSSSRSEKGIKLAAASKPKRSSSGITSSSGSGKRKLPPQLSSKAQAKTKSTSRSKSKMVSTTTPPVVKNLGTERHTEPLKPGPKVAVPLKEVIGLGEEDHLSPIPPSPASVADCLDGEDDDYCPSYFAPETEDELDHDSPPPSAIRRKRSRSQEEDEEEWTMGTKNNGKKKVKESIELVESIGGAPPKERKLNKTRNRFYHPGRQEQNVRAQSKYRNKIKARSDLVLEFVQEIFHKVRNTPAAKKLIKKLEELDPTFAEERFGKL
ncbi:hypothetical protein V866_001836 [Kwoniella sp. B9012]